MDGIITVFFVFYFWQLKRYAEGRKEFAENFLITRKRALNSAYKAVANGEKLEVEELLHADDVPVQIKEYYREWLFPLSQHYRDLLLSKGNTFEELICSTYRSKKSLHRFYQQLNQVEQQFNTHLQPHLDIDDPTVPDIIKKIEAISAKLRHREVKEIFS